MKKNIIIIILCILVLSLTGYIVYDKVLSDNNLNNQSSVDNNLASNNNECHSETVNICNNLVFDYKELLKLGKGDYNFIKYVKFGNYEAYLGADGKIRITNSTNTEENYISNIKNAKEMYVHGELGPNLEVLYILTSDGNIYNYKISNYKSGDYNATKDEKYSNIIQMIDYHTIKKNAGGCSHLIAVDNKGKLYKLHSLCV